MELVLQTLVCDGRLEEVRSAVVALAGHASSARNSTYKVANSMKSPNFFTESPCGVCPVIGSCVVGGVISPTTCEYMAQWLGISLQEELF